MTSRSGRAVSRLAVVTVLAVAAAALALTAGSTGRRSAAAAGTMTPDTLRAPNIREAIQEAADPSGSVQFSCQKTKPAGCYGPDQMRRAYGVQPLLDRGYDGAGRTIAIIDAYGSPTLSTDVSNFDSIWGLPAINLHVDTPYGVAPTDPNNAAGWAGETSLDVEWAHAIAPGATIELVVAKSSDDSDILDATQWAIDHNAGDVVSQSFGEAEQCMAPSDLARQHALFQEGVQQGITFFASSGDTGAAQPTCDGSDVFKAVSTPASDPNVTAVGGTDLIANGRSGAYLSESTWNESAIFSQIYGDNEAVAGGGGVSTLYRKPLYQALVNHGSMRELPDVSYNAAVFNGVIVAFGGDTCGPNGPGSGTDPCFYRFGGTSAGSPQWSAIIAIVDQMAHHRMGNINPALYALALLPGRLKPFHDIADGSDNSVPNVEGQTIQGYQAVPGYDMATGLGSPNIAALVSAAAQRPPSTSPLR